MILDIAETPALGTMNVNGLLTFADQEGGVHLRANNVFVRAGELHIGNATHPYQNKAHITLMGG